MPDTVFTDVIAQRVTSNGTILYDAIFTRVRVQQFQFTDTNFAGVQMLSSDLSEGKFSRMTFISNRLKHVTSVTTVLVGTEQHNRAVDNRAPARPLLVRNQIHTNG